MTKLLLGFLLGLTLLPTQAQAEQILTCGNFTNRAGRYVPGVSRAIINRTGDESIEIIYSLEAPLPNPTRYEQLQLVSRTERSLHFVGRKPEVQARVRISPTGQPLFATIAVGNAYATCSR